MVCIEKLQYVYAIAYAEVVTCLKVHHLCCNVRLLILVDSLRIARGPSVQLPKTSPRPPPPQIKH
jgi:hypothetical protein